MSKAQIALSTSSKLSQSEGYPIVVGGAQNHWLGMTRVAFQQHRPSKHKKKAKKSNK
jgi:hypothetical protein